MATQVPLTTTSFVLPAVQNQALAPVNRPSWQLNVDHLAHTLIAPLSSDNNRPSGQLKVEGNRTVDLAPINQALAQLTEESLRNQEKILDNITLLFDAVQSLEARNQVLTNENFLLKERLRRVECDNEELSRSFNRFANVSNVTANAQTARIDELETNVLRTEDRFDRHHHTSPSGQTSGPEVPGPMRFYGFFEKFKATYHQT